MSQVSQTNIRSLFIRFISKEPVETTPFLIKGALMKMFPNEKFVSFVNGEMRGIYLYPRVQVKILRKQLCIFAISEGIMPTHSIAEKLTSLDAGDITYHFDDFEQHTQSNGLFTVTHKLYHKYKFITPWVALNGRQLTQYETMFSNERRSFLNSALIKNIEFVITELDCPVQPNIQIRFRTSSLYPKTVEYSHFGSFKGLFTTNVVLPNYLGLGNSITKGLGSLIRVEANGIRQTENHPEVCSQRLNDLNKVDSREDNNIK